jgi:hypothetical protein
MNVMVLNTTTSIGSWFNDLFAKVNRSFYKIGYYRAATELTRLGYVEEARQCLKELNRS